MATSDRIESDLAVPPGEYLQEVLEEVEMSQAELSRRLGRPVQAVNEIVKGVKAITPESALQLQQVLPVPAHVWTGLEEAYRLALAKAKEDRKLDDENGLVDVSLYRKLADGGQVASIDGRSPEGRRNRVRELRRFFGVASLENVPNVGTYRAAFRVGAAGGTEAYALATWLRWGEISASSQGVEAKFDRGRLREALLRLRQCTCTAPDAWIPSIRGELERCGVAFAVVPHLPKTRAHGAAFWPKPTLPVVQLSLRGKRGDIFWFSLFHEIGHLLLHGKREVFVSDAPPSARAATDEERQANAFARDQLVPPRPYEAFRSEGDLTENAIRAFATNISVHPSIVLGRLQRDGALPHHRYGHLHQRIDGVEARGAP